MKVKERETWEWQLPFESLDASFASTHFNVQTACSGIQSAPGAFNPRLCESLVPDRPSSSDNPDSESRT